MVMRATLPRIKHGFLLNAFRLTNDRTGGYDVSFWAAYVCS